MRFPKDINKLPDWFGLVAIGDNKAPYMEDWQKTPLTKAQVVAEVETGRCKAVGVLCGPQSGGLLIVDHDGSSAQEVVKKLSNGGRLPLTAGVTSGRPGRFALLYLVPEEYWDRIKTRKIKTGVTGEDGKAEQLELRWDGCQSVLMGAHPTTGSYRDLEGQEFGEVELEIAPDWMIQAMIREETTEPRQQTQPRQQSNDYDRWTDSDWALSYLKALSPDRADDYESWVAVGMALHSVGDSGLLNNYVAFSQQSSKYKSGDAEKKWKSFKRDGLGLGTLAKMAKEDGWKNPFDELREIRPYRQDRPDHTPDRPASKTERQKPQRPEFNETLDQVDLLEQAIDDDAQLLWEAQNFAVDSDLFRRGFKGQDLLRLARSRRDGTASIEMCDAHDIMERQKAPEMLVGALLPEGVVIAVGALGGTGKTTLFYNIAKHIALGTPWNGYSVKQGKVLVIQCDESKQDINRKLRAAKYGEVPHGSVRFVTEWRFTQYRQLERMVRQEQYRLVVIDSWTSVHAGMGIDLAKSAAGDNIYLLRNLAQETNCTFVVLHHLNKAGGYRDSSTIEDNPSEVWKITRGRPEDRLKPTERLLEITKSRAGLEGKYLLEQIGSDYSWMHKGPFECPDSVEEPGLMLRIQDYFVMHPGEFCGAKDIATHFCVTYDKAEMELQRLETIGVLESQWVVWNKPTGEQTGFWSYALAGTQGQRAAVQQLPSNVVNFPIKQDTPWEDF